MPDAVGSISPVPLRTAAPARASFPVLLKSSSASAQASATATPGPGVIASIRNGLRWALLGPTITDFKTRDVVRRPDLRYPDMATVTAANQHLKSAAPLEIAALAKLGARAAEYRAVAELCARSPVSHDVLLKMLLDGRLVGQKDLQGKADMLSYLNTLATQQLPSGMDRSELVSCLIQEMDDPVKLAQADKGTCAATTATVVLDRKRPAEYARLVAELASPAARATTVNGTIIKRNDDWANNNDGSRTPSMRLLEPALMQLGNPLLKYDNGRDAYTLETKGFLQQAAEGLSQAWSSVKSKIALPGGLETAGMNHVLECLTGEEFDMIYMITRVNRPFAWQRVEAAVASGKSVPCGLVWEDGGHEILLDKIQDGFCYFNNPWGETDKLSVEEFRANLTGVNLPRG